MRRPLLALALALAACNPDPGELDQQVGYRAPGPNAPEDPNSGERGSVKISEILWSGTVRNDGTWDPTDVFIEIRNEGDRPMNLSRWFLVVEGTAERTYRIPSTTRTLDVGQHGFVATRADGGCLLDPDWVIPDLWLPQGDPFRVTLLDADERLIEPAGSRSMPPFAGGYDLHSSRSMERVELMFGGQGTEPQSWHFYNKGEVDVPNNDRIAEDCRARTLASPGRPNSPDYSGAFANGSLE